MSKSKPGSGTGRKAKTAEYLETATDKSAPAKGRASAMRHAVADVCESKKTFQSVLKVLLDVEEPLAVRLAALQSLQAASFRVVQFEPYRQDYIAALRTLGKDPELEVRKQALGILAREKDRPTQRRLLQGLENPEKAPLPPEKALQYLSYDVHADAYPVAKKIIKDPPSEKARQEALRLLAADASSAPVFEKLLRDKSESLEVRQICAAALQGVKPHKYQEYAREIALDDDDDQDLRAQSLTALTQFGDAESLAQDEPLRKRVENLKAAAPAKVKKSARQFLEKYGK